MSTSIPTITLNDGNTMPQEGFGVWQVPDDTAYTSVLEALKAGYRSIDTAMIYGNEAGVGKAIVDSRIPREELFITTKLWTSDLGAGKSRPALEKSLEILGLDYVDLYLIHWPAPQNDAYLDTWKEFEQLKADGLTKSIGVSNFTPEHLDKLIALGGEKPVLNQVEVHPTFSNTDTQATNATYGVATEAWSPLGSGVDLNNPHIAAIATELNVSTAQVILRWHLQEGRIIIPKSVTPERITQNLDIYNFELSPEQLKSIDNLDVGEEGRTGPNPAEFMGM